MVLKREVDRLGQSGALPRVVDGHGEHAGVDHVAAARLVLGLGAAGMGIVLGLGCGEGGLGAVDQLTRGPGLLTKELTNVVVS